MSQKTMTFFHYNAQVLYRGETGLVGETTVFCVAQDDDDAMTEAMLVATNNLQWLKCEPLKVFNVTKAAAVNLA